jgi:taurine dioxygenase
MGADGAHGRHKEILVISNAVVDGRPAGTMANDEAIWHSDTFIYEVTPAAAILRALQLPPEGGDTQFADMYLVYEKLPAAIRSVIEGRFMQVDVVFDAAGGVRAGQQFPSTDDIRLWPGMRHPIVRTHGESLRNCIYVGADVQSLWIVGLPLDESRAILDEIFALVRNPSVQWTQVWEDGDILMWDNRCTMHRRDGWSAQYTRVMHRTTTMGERPFYRC